MAGANIDEGKLVFSWLKIFIAKKIKNNFIKNIVSSKDLSNESVEVLRERLSTMKRLMAERQNAQQRQQQQKPSIDDILFHKATRNVGIIDGNFLSFALCGALCVIIVVAIYAFYSLYNAVLKKFPSHHTEL